MLVHVHVLYRPIPLLLCFSPTCRYCPLPNTRRGASRRPRGQRDALEKKQKEEQDLAEYITSLEVKRKYPPHVIEALRNLDHDQIGLELLLELIKVICREQEPGAILVFLPGWDTISKLHDMLRADPVFRSSQYLIIPLHSLMPTSFQQSVRPHAVVQCAWTVHVVMVHMLHDYSVHALSHNTS